MRTAIYPLLIVALSGCIPPQTEAPDSVSELLSGELIDLETHSIAQKDLMRLSPEMTRWVSEKTQPSKSQKTRLNELVQGLLDDGLLNLEYDENETFTPIETFNRRSGNCLSFSLLFVALAREAGLDVTFQMVEIPPSFTTKGELVVLNNHINVLVENVRHDTTFRQDHVVDFNNAEYNGNYDTRRVNDSYAIALYHSNVGVERLHNGDHAAAFSHFTHGIAVNQRVPGIWTNLGTLYSKLNRPDEAIKAYQQALSIQPSHKPSLVNIAVALKDVGRLEESAYYRKRAAYYRNRNPYFHQQNAARHFRNGEYEQALYDLEQAIEIKEDEHQFYYLQGLLYTRLGQKDMASQSFAAAAEAAEKKELVDAYHRKINRLKSG